MSESGFYTIDDLHYNSRKIAQVSETEDFIGLESTLKAVKDELKNSSFLEKNMLSFFKNEVLPLAAYKDNDVNQGKVGPRRLHVVGKLNALDKKIGLFVRLGILAPDENPLIPTLDLLYLQENKHPKYIRGEHIGIEKDPDKWFYSFTDRYQGIVEGVKVRTEMGIKSLFIIPIINEILLGNKPQQLKEIITREYDLNKILNPK